jgi:hypothetical protein
MFSFLVFCTVKVQYPSGRRSPDYCSNSTNTSGNMSWQWFREASLIMVSDPPLGSQACQRCNRHALLSLSTYCIHGFCPGHPARQRHNLHAHRSKTGLDFAIARLLSNLDRFVQKLLNEGPKNTSLLTLLSMSIACLPLMSRHAMR